MAKVSWIRSPYDLPCQLQPLAPFPFSSFGNESIIPSHSLDPIIDYIDLSIAIRKEVQSCTQHPISNFVSYDPLSSYGAFVSFVSYLSSVSIP